MKDVKPEPAPEKCSVCGGSGFDESVWSINAAVPEACRGCHGGCTREAEDAVTVEILRD